MTASFYERLGVGRDADDEAIRRAYRERLKETHPDLSDAPDAHAKTRMLVEAKETLLDSVERRRYDRLGHENYVGSERDAGGSSATRAAREAGWGTDAAARERASWTSTGTSGPTNARTGPAERRARERRARERVDADGRESSDGRTGGSDVEGSASTAQGVSSPAEGSSSTANGAASTARATSGWSTSMADRRVRPTVDPTNRGARERTVWSSLFESPATAMATFGLYPLLVAGAVFPPFPLYVNVIVAACTVMLIAVLQSMPGIGVVVFASWSVLGAAGLAVAGVHPISLLGLLVLGSTWFPLGLSVLTYWALRA